MKIKTVKRYYCDFCKKSGCSGGHLKRHEASCTLNPGRTCRMCVALMLDGDERPTVADLIALIPESLRNREPFTFEEPPTPTAPVLAALREKSGDCPVCIFAALRQAGAANWFNGGEFRFKDEVKAKWDEINGAQEEHYAYI